MTDRRRLVIRWTVTLGVVLGIAGTDLWSKRWIEENLATSRHLLPVTAPAGASGMSVAEVVRTRFPDLDDGALHGSLWRLPPQVALDPGDPVFELESSRNLEAVGFFVFDTGKVERFARRIERNDSWVMEKALQRDRPELGLLEARRQVREVLSRVSVAEYLKSRLPHLSDEEASEVARTGLHPIPMDGAEVDPASRAVPGQTYLVGSRDIVLIPGFFDFSYAENPAGAFSMLLGVDEGLRRAIFFTLSIVALVAVGWLLVKPPGDGLLPVIALGGIMGGAIGNLIDRLRLTYVVDFIHNYWRDWHWPRYNVADIGISVGVVVLLLITLFASNPSPKTPKT
jgi:signal peptidase II